MLVELKKVKISKSIFDQIAPVDLATISFDNYLERDLEILGWVFFKQKYVLLQNKSTKDIFKWLLMQTICIDQEDPKRINYSVSGRIGSRRFLFEQEATNFFRTVLSVQKTAKSKGQIFI